MEGLSPLHERVGVIDVHRMLHVVTALVENDDGTITKHQKEFGGFKRDMKSMAAWLLELEVTLVVMESTGIYWKSAHAQPQGGGHAFIGACAGGADPVGGVCVLSAALSFGAALRGQNLRGIAVRSEGRGARGDLLPGDGFAQGGFANADLAGNFGGTMAGREEVCALRYDLGGHDAGLLQGGLRVEASRSDFPVLFHPVHQGAVRHVERRALEVDCSHVSIRHQAGERKSFSAAVTLRM